MTYDQAVEIINPVYMFHFVSGTYSEYEIDDLLINALVRKGVSRSQARKWVLMFLDT